MKAVILAAGEGVRMRPLTLTLPKPLLTVQGKPLLLRLVESFPKEIDELIIVVGYLEDKIKEYCGSSFCGRPVKYVTQAKAGGTYKALELCAPLLDSEPFMLFFSDDLLSKDAIAKCAAEPLALTAARVEDARAFGVIDIDDNGFVKDIIEKPEIPPTNLVATSCYKLSTDIFNYPPAQHPRTGEYYLSESISRLAHNQKIRIVIADFWFPIANPEDLRRANELSL
jgi:UDP-N-acetylglucosamine diphosphorylase / glucose-1-phosphate thymidylyltransferase / UDP-N-acetylgalactosamine diphosphorylase / glucosamine-1-phosphate N-acetyltransferase / galactosamine-1-phosphate N-acetyltransferase